MKSTKSSRPLRRIKTPSHSGQKKLYRSSVKTLEPQSERAASTAEICAALHERGIECTAVENNAAAVKRLMSSGGDVKIIAGSLYLIGAIRNKILQI